MKTKQYIRKETKEAFLRFTSKQKSISDKNIFSQIYPLLSWSDIKHICIYESMKDEVDTSEIIKKLWEIGKKVYIPKVISPEEMILIDSITGKEYTQKIDVFIIPGRAFSLNWERLGRGKGYYDRFLRQKQYKNSKKVWICYTFQVIDFIPTNTWDINMDIIISW